MTVGRERKGTHPIAVTGRRRSWLLGVPLLIAVGGYLGAIAYMRANETAFVFHPDQYGGRTMVAPIAELPAEAVRVRSADSLELSAWVIPPAAGPDSAPFWVLFMHGNAANFSVPARQAWARALRAQGVGLVMFDYRGYGASADGPLHEAGLYRDARSVYDWMQRERGIEADRIILFGHSLGTGVATELATTVEAAGLVLEGAFTSIPDVGAGRYPWLPVRWLARERFASEGRADSIAMPKLLLHARDDAAVPFALGQRLFAAMPAPKEFVTLTGGHDRAFAADSATYFGAIAAWLDALRVTDRESPPPG